MTNLKAIAIKKGLSELSSAPSCKKSKIVDNTSSEDPNDIIANEPIEKLEQAISILDELVDEGKIRYIKFFGGLFEDLLIKANFGQNNEAKKQALNDTQIILKGLFIQVDKLENYPDNAYSRLIKHIEKLDIMISGNHSGLIKYEINPYYENEEHTLTEKEYEHYLDITKNI